MAVEDRTLAPSQYACPVIGCGWTHTAHPSRRESAADGGPEESASELVARVLVRDEDELILRDHLETHDVTEWADTCRQLRSGTVELLPAEHLVLTVALAQVKRGEVPPENVSVMCVLALARITGQHDWTQEAG